MSLHAPPGTPTKPFTQRIKGQRCLRTRPRRSRGYPGTRSRHNDESVLPALPTAATPALMTSLFKRMSSYAPAGTLPNPVWQRIHGQRCLHTRPRCSRGYPGARSRHTDESVLAAPLRAVTPPTRPRCSRACLCTCQQALLLEPSLQRRPANALVGLRLVASSLAEAAAQFAGLSEGRPRDTCRAQSVSAPHKPHQCSIDSHASAQPAVGLGESAEGGGQGARGLGTDWLAPQQQMAWPWIAWWGWYAPLRLSWMSVSQ